MAKKNAAVEVQAVPTGYVPSLKKVYKEEIVEKLMKQFSNPKQMARFGRKKMKILKKYLKI